MSKKHYLIGVLGLLGILSLAIGQTAEERATKRRQEKVIGFCAQVSGMLATDGAQWWCITRPLPQVQAAEP